MGGRTMTEAKSEKKDEIDEMSVVVLLDTHLRKILMETDLLLKYCLVYELDLEDAIRDILKKINRTTDTIEAMK
jgi:hypothetical protein